MKSRARNGRETRIARHVREPVDVVLIVCEGAKTEPLYFSGIRDELRLGTANVVVVGEECGSSPKTVVEYAIGKFKESRDFDRIFCVFDRDDHPDFAEAVSRCSAVKLVNTAAKVCAIEAVTSNPCFEYWMFLHFEDSDAPVVAARGKSSGGVMLSKLKKHIPGYEKGRKSTFRELKPLLPDALRRARRINALGNDNPHTKVDKLVRYLLDLRRGAGLDWVENIPR